MSKTVILGTAGHIDHGKSSLVRALTGTDPDRLKEEKERGITIELGFARISLPWERSPASSTCRGHEQHADDGGRGGRESTSSCLSSRRTRG